MSDKNWQGQAEHTLFSFHLLDPINPFFTIQLENKVNATRNSIHIPENIHTPHTHCLLALVIRGNRISTKINKNK